MTHSVSRYDISCYSFCAFSYVPYFNQQNALIKMHTSQNTLYIRYQLLHVSAPRCQLHEAY